MGTPLFVDHRSTPLLPTHPWRTRPACRVWLACLMLISGALASGAVTATAQDKAATTGSLRVTESAEGAGWIVHAGDRILAGYEVDSAGKPIVYPLKTPSGVSVVRDYPMKPQGPNERDDHPHHRSLWFTHGEVNDTDYWLTSEAKRDGITKQTGGKAYVDNSTGAVVIETTNDWLNGRGKRDLTDTRRFTFQLDGKRLILDCDIRLTASDGEVHFGDTKEGSFGVRVAGSMKSDAKLGGQITNKDGQHGKEAWGVRSPWVDYSGPVLEFDATDEKPSQEVIADSTNGVTIHYHPSSHGAPCRWHVRTYGLFAANPFGESHFTGGEKTGGFRLPAGESIDLFHRVVIHEGGFDRDQTLADEAGYASISPKPLD